MFPSSTPPSPTLPPCTLALVIDPRTRRRYFTSSSTDSRNYTVRKLLAELVARRKTRLSFSLCTNVREVYFTFRELHRSARSVPTYLPRIRQLSPRRDACSLFVLQACVWEHIDITNSFYLKQERKEKRKKVNDEREREKEIDTT